ncbi:MAG: hypothetical protein ACOX3W_04985 [Christensenellaceae bacterium]|jgi:hypothetical protein
MNQKKLSLLLALVLCLSCLLPIASAAAADDPIIVPFGTLSLTGSLTRTKAQGTLKSSNVEYLRIYCHVYKVSGSTRTPVTSFSNTATARSVTATQTVSLSAGTYELVMYGYGTYSVNRTLTFNL